MIISERILATLLILTGVVVVYETAHALLIWAGVV